MVHECLEIPMLSLFKHECGPYSLALGLNVPANALKPIDISVTTNRFMAQYGYFSYQCLEYGSLLRLGKS